MVDTLPLLPSGKVDQLALKALADAPTQHQAELKSLPVNADVAQIWRIVLGQDEIEAADDFFDLGGNSLPAMHEIPIRALFDNPTLAGFSRAVEAAPPVDDEASGEIRPQARSETELAELRERLLSLSSEELDALIRIVGEDKR